MNRRASQILQLINKEKFLSVNDLSASIGVSEVTIRKDLKMLDEQGLIIRTHGGASAVQEGVYPFHTRQTIEIDEKYWLAKQAVELIRDGNSILVDAGTTSLRIAQMLKERRVSIVTNSLPVALELASSQATVTMTSGILFSENMCLVGPDAEAFISNIRVNKLILGASGLRLEEGPTTSSSLEAVVKQRMIQAAQEVILVMNHSKLSEVGLSTFASFRDIDVLITSARAPRDTVQHIESFGVKVILVQLPENEVEK